MKQIFWKQCGDWRELILSDYESLGDTPTGLAIEMLDGSIPTLVCHDDRFICSKSVAAEIRREHDKVMTYDQCRKHLSADEKRQPFKQFHL